MVPQARRLAGRTAIVTGAAGGIGAATAALLAEHGANVVVTDIDVARGREVAAACGAGFVEHDVTSADDWAVTVATTLNRFGRLDVLVNNAGGTFGRRGSLEETAREDYDYVVAVNLTGVWLGMQSVIAPMREQGGGSIVNISSLAGMLGFPAMAAYTAAKWGVRGLTKSTATELGVDRIRVNSIHPGFTASRVETAATTTEEIATTGGFRGAHVPLGRAGLAEDLARAVLYLASDDSSYVTGAELVVDGGAMVSPMIPAKVS